jgi:hypothetical protein
MIVAELLDGLSVRFGDLLWLIEPVSTKGDDQAAG